MTAEAIAVVEEESVIPAPPPPPLPEEAGDDFNPSRSRGLYRIWDMVAIYGPAKDLDIFPKIGGQPGGAWRAYARIKGVDPKERERNPKIVDDAQRWAFEEEVKFGLKNGYLVRDKDGLLTIGTCPPEHEPLRTTGGKDGVVHVLSKEENSKALEILLNKTNPARMKPTREGKARLKASLKEVGQQYPVLMWQPPNPGSPEVVVDGRTRWDLLNELGIEPRVHWIPSTLTAQEVLLLRINLEISASSKSWTKADRDSYIAELAAQGVKQADIAEQFGLSRNRVSEILSHVSEDRHLRQSTPTLGEVETWVSYVERGWPYRDIAEFVTGWSKDTIQRHVTKYRETAAAASKDAAAKAVVEVAAEVEKEEVESVLAEVKPSNRAKTSEGRKQQAKKLKPLVDLAKEKGRSSKPAQYIIKDHGALKMAIEADEGTANAAAEALRAAGWTVVPPKK